ncbi:MAG: hypothetical protein JST16_18125 [Bdellovibrionales bacterium]|nr:hypothetical protein [Bdellovibrionales bacterium]
MFGRYFRGWTPQKKIFFSGALLVLVGMVTGLWSAAALTGQVTLVIPRLALAAHLNGLMGGLLLIAVGVSFAHLGYDSRQLYRLTWLVSLPCWANWLVTLVASILGVNGLSYTDNRSNNGVAFALQVLVVLPMFFACAYWLRGFLLQIDPKSRANL